MIRIFVVDYINGCNTRQPERTLVLVGKGEDKMYIVGRIEKAALTVVTDVGEQKTEVNGEVLFVFEKNRLQLHRLSMVARSVKSRRDETGHISINLARGRKRFVDIGRDGEFEVKTELTVHYPLIDKERGFRPSEKKDQHYFVPYVDTMKGTLRGRFERHPSKFVDMIDDDSKKLDYGNLKLGFALKPAEYEWVKEVRLDMVFPIIFFIAFERYLRIQPVFIRTGRDDPSPSGWTFEPMMQSAKCIWKKCCVDFEVLDPVYVDDGAYKEIQDVYAQEVTNLRAEVTDPDAIEIFVISQWTNPDRGGGGGTWSSGTANAQIVTSDQQLAVPVNKGAINRNHLAHELGHVLSLVHPGDPVTAPMTAAGTANTVLEPSGFQADNPHAQSADNCRNIDNPLLKWRLVLRSRRCINSPEL